MTLDELNFNGDAKGIKVIQTQRGKVDANDPYSQWNLCLAMPPKKCLTLV